jgi:hypothetical protein
MREIDEYREKLMERFVTAAREFRAACLAARSPDEPLETGGWSIHQLAAHTRDVDQLVYGARARLTIVENDPIFQNFDGDAYMNHHYDPDEPLRQLLDEFVASVEALIRELREMPSDGWTRASRHETQGSGLTLQTWVERGLGHIEEHLATVREAPSHRK